MKTVWILHAAANAHTENWETVQLVQEFRRHNLHAMVLQPRNFDIITSRRGGKSIRYLNHAMTLPHAVLVRTGAGTFYFTQSLLRQIEAFGVPVINSCDSIIKSRDKMWSGQILASANIPVPRTMLVNFPVNADIVEHEIGFPCVVKLVSGSQGRGVYLCHDRKFFVDLMELVENLKTKKSIMVQEYIGQTAQHAADIRVWTMAGQALAVMRRVAPPGDFRANISNGGHGEPMALTPDIAHIAESTSKAFGLDIAGIDLLQNDLGLWVCEANSSPGFQGIDQYCHTRMAQHIVEYVAQRIAAPFPGD